MRSRFDDHNCAVARALDEGGVRGLLFGDEGGQLVAGLIGIGCNLIYVGTSAAFCFWLVDKLAGNRVSLADELTGLDVPELGMEGYSLEPPPPGGPVPTTPAPGVPAHTSPSLTLPGTLPPDRPSWPAGSPASLAPAGAFSSEIGAAPFQPFKTRPGT